MSSPPSSSATGDVLKSAGKALAAIAVLGALALAAVKLASSAGANRDTLVERALAQSNGPDTQLSIGGLTEAVAGIPARAAVEKALHALDDAAASGEPQAFDAACHRLHQAMHDAGATLPALIPVTPQVGVLCGAKHADIPLAAWNALAPKVLAALAVRPSLTEPRAAATDPGDLAEELRDRSQALGQVLTSTDSEQACATLERFGATLGRYAQSLPPGTRREKLLRLSSHDLPDLMRTCSTMGAEERTVEMMSLQQRALVP